MRLAMILSVTLLSLSALASPALAQPGSSAPGQSTPFAPGQSTPFATEPPPPNVDHYPTQTTTTKYGWQVFAADATTWVLLASMSNSNSEGLGSLAGLGVLFGGPIVHLAQGNASSAGYSLLARTGLPLAGFLLGSATCDNDDSWDCLGNVFLGGMVGYGSALAIDWFYLAQKTEVTRPATGWASLQPSLQIAPSGAKAGVAFKF